MAQYKACQGLQQQKLQCFFYCCHGNEEQVTCLTREE